MKQTQEILETTTNHHHHRQEQDNMDSTTTITAGNHRFADKEQADEVKYKDGDVAIHSQVKKIKQELEKINQPTALEQPEMRSVLRDFSRQQKRSRSPLGITNRPISVGNS